MVFIVVIVLAVISVVLSIRTYMNLHKMKEVEHAQGELKRGKVIFQRDSELSPSSEA